MQRVALSLHDPRQAVALNGLARLLALRPKGRIVIAGGPRSGKSVLASKLPGVPVRGTDDLIGLGWSESSLAASYWFDNEGPWICEGVTMPRALRKWLARVPEGKPADLAVWLGVPVVARSRGQHVMALGCLTVWNEIREALHARGTELYELNG